MPQVNFASTAKDALARAASNKAAAASAQVTACASSTCSFHDAIFYTKFAACAAAACDEASLRPPAHQRCTSDARSQAQALAVRMVFPTAARVHQGSQACEAVAAAPALEFKCR